MARGDFDPKAMLSALAGHDVRFVLIGGMAAVLHGDVGVTVDVDVVPDRSPDNLARLARALRDLGARIRTESEPKGLPFDCSPQFFSNLSPDSIVNMTTDSGDLDVTFCPSGTQGFSDLCRDAVEIEAASRLRILVASLDDVIRSKEAAGRDKDRLALPRLRRLRDRLARDG
jgi:hypothetical protein